LKHCRDTPIAEVAGNKQWQISEEYIVVDNVSKSYNDFNAVKNISLSINKGELFSLLGGSGCGKTTLLRMLAGFEKPSSGKIYIDGVDVTDWPPYKRPVNMMFQSYALFPHMNVYQNIAFGLKYDNTIKKDAIDSRVAEVLNLVQLSGFEHRKINQLSGGQMQRVALARSLAKRPKLLLLDEPLAALDKKLREQTQFELVNIQERVGITFIMVTHDQEEAMTMSSRIGIMEDGKVLQVGVPHDIYEFPNSRYVAKFIGDINLFDGTVVESGMDYVDVEAKDMDRLFHVEHTGTIPIGSEVAVAIRPEKVMISTTKPNQAKNWTSGVVEEIAYLGDISIYHIAIQSGRTIKATLPNLLRMSERNIEWEDVVYLFWRAENSIILTS
jgi:putrescine transport system ATP-binding protein